MVFYMINNQINKQWGICSGKRTGLVGSLPVGLYFFATLLTPLFCCLSTNRMCPVTWRHQHVPYFECLLILTQGGLWKDQSCGSRPSCSRVAAEMWCQSEVSRFRTLAPRLQRTANWASGQIQDPGDWCHWILHHVQRIWPPGSVLQCGEYYVLVPLSFTFPSHMFIVCLFVFPLNRFNISKTGLGGWKMKRNICFSEVLNISGTKKSKVLRSEDGKIHIFNQIQRNYLLYTCLISDFQCYIVRLNSNSVSASGPLPLSDAAT